MIMRNFREILKTEKYLKNTFKCTRGQPTKNIPEKSSEPSTDQ